MTTIKKNYEIALFMGYIDNGCSDDGFLIHPETNYDEDISELKYHSDWNWLMKVVEKIENLGISVNIKATWNNFHNCTYTQTSIKKEKGEFGNSKQCFWVHDIVYHGHSDTKIKKIDSVHEAVYQFVVWHNQQVKL